MRANPISIQETVYKKLEIQLDELSRQHKYTIRRTSAYRHPKKGQPNDFRGKKLLSPANVTA